MTGQHQQSKEKVTRSDKSETDNESIGTSSSSSSNSISGPVNRSYSYSSSSTDKLRKKSSASLSSKELYTNIKKTTIMEFAKSKNSSICDMNKKLLDKLNSMSFKKQAIWFMNAFYYKGVEFSNHNDLCKLVFEYTKKAEDLASDDNCNALNEMQAHILVEKVESAMTVKKMRETLRKSGLEIYKTISLAEILICRFHVDWRDLISAPQGTADDRHLVEFTDKLVCDADVVLLEKQKVVDKYKREEEIISDDLKTLQNKHSVKMKEIELKKSIKLDVLLLLNKANENLEYNRQMEELLLEKVNKSKSIEEDLEKQLSEFSKKSLELQQSLRSIENSERFDIDKQSISEAFSKDGKVKKKKNKLFNAFLCGCNARDQVMLDGNNEPVMPSNRSSQRIKVESELLKLKSEIENLSKSHEQADLNYSMLEKSRKKSTQTVTSADEDYQLLLAKETLVDEEYNVLEKELAAFETKMQCAVAKLDAKTLQRLTAEKNVTYQLSVVQEMKLKQSQLNEQLKKAGDGQKWWNSYQLHHDKKYMKSEEYRRFDEIVEEHKNKGLYVNCLPDAVQVSRPMSVPLDLDESRQPLKSPSIVAA